VKIFVVLPAYNEAENIPSLLEQFVKLKENPYLASKGIQLSIILVDDGSKEQTVQRAKDFSKKIQIIIEQHPHNLGLGQALRTGFKKALSLVEEDDHDLILTMDADNSHSPELTLRMLKKIEEGYDLIIASRYSPQGKEIGLNFLRRLLSFFCSFILRIFVPLKNVRDYSSGFRLIRAKFLKELAEKTKGDFFKDTGFVATAEVLIELVKCGAKVEEVPLILRYDLKKGKSKMNVVKTILGYGRLLFYKNS